MTAKLYLIATPLGNRDDITLRALKELARLDVLFAEDTRELAKLIDLHGVARGEKKLFSLAQHNMKEAVERAIGFLTEGKDVGFTSDRGTPAISDPGSMLVREARRAGFEAVPIPGPSSVTAALSVSGVDADRFLFLGFLPREAKAREPLWEVAEAAGLTVCLFESPKRVRDTLRELQQRFPKSQVVVARELTKIHETISVVCSEELNPDVFPELGEYVLMVAPAPQRAAPQAWQTELALRLMSDREWSKQIAARFGVSASEAYNALQRARGK